MKKIVILLLNFLTVNAIADQKSIKQNVQPKLVPPAKYVEVRLDQPFVYGNFHAATDKQIEIKELLNLQCFYVFDYLGSKPITQEELDKANPQKLPWCQDPSGGTLHKSTGKTLGYKIDDKTQFFVWQLKSEEPRLAVTKEAFIKQVNDVKGELIKIKVREGSKNIIDTIQTVYTD